jgi:exodeoxyribonuclease-3
MKLVSWNVNGIRAVQKKGFNEYVAKENPDVLCLQEVKATKEQGGDIMKGYHAFWNSAQKKGYSGTAIFSKKEPINVTYGIGLEEHDTEGRVITAEFDDYHVLTVYTPNAQRGLTRLDYRLKWDEVFRDFVKNLEKKKPVIFCGDLNVAHNEIDIAHPTSNRNNPGFTDAERNSFSKLLDTGFVDSFRHFNKDPHQYSWWSYMFNARAKNIGWRIDYFCASEKIKHALKSAFIRQDIHGSDHCPVGLVLK